MIVFFDGFRHTPHPPQPATSSMATAGAPFSVRKQPRLPLAIMPCSAWQFSASWQNGSSNRSRICRFLHEIPVFFGLFRSKRPPTHRLIWIRQRSLRKPPVFRGFSTWFLITPGYPPKKHPRAARGSAHTHAGDTPVPVRACRVIVGRCVMGVLSGWRVRSQPDTRHTRVGGGMVPPHPLPVLRVYTCMCVLSCLVFVRERLRGGSVRGEHQEGGQARFRGVVEGVPWSQRDVSNMRDGTVPNTAG